MFKRIVIIAVCFVLLTGFAGNYSADAVELKSQEHVITPDWENVLSVSLDMSFSNGTITSTGTVRGQSGTTAITATFVLARRNANGTFTEVDRWIAVNGNIPSILTSSRTTQNQPAGTYRLSITTSVTRNGKTETVPGNHTATFR